jgi:hypothetical protein
MKIKIMLPDRDGKPTSVSVSALKIGKYFAIHRDNTLGKESKRGAYKSRHCDEIWMDDHASSDWICGSQSNQIQQSSSEGSATT